MKLLHSDMSVGETTWPRGRSAAFQLWERLLYHKLDYALRTARIVPVDPHARIIFFSDCHRGNNGRSDAFKPNKPLFLKALSHYNQQAYTYIEVGDGDELWKVKEFEEIQQAHAEVFDLLHAFKRDKRLHLLYGNHDTRLPPILPPKKAGLPTVEALRLVERSTQREVFVVHGHQIDFSSSWFQRISQAFVGSIYNLGQKAGFISLCEQLDNTGSKQTLTRRMRHWVSQRQVPTICGHIHAPFFSSSGTPPYFNTGSCLYPNQITGLELTNGILREVSWSRNARGEIVRRIGNGGRRLFGAP